MTVSSAGAPKAAGGAIQHAGEPSSNDFRRRLAAVEPRSLRTFTPSMAVIARSAGCWHWTPEGRKLADFTSGVLVANLGYNPTRWWQRVFEYLELERLDESSEFTAAAPLNAYNAVTPIETIATERLIGNLRRQPGGSRLQKVLWAASGSEAIQKSLWATLARSQDRRVILATRYGFHGKKGLAAAVTGSESDPDRDERVRFLSFPREECINVERRRRPLDLTPYAAELEAIRAREGDRIACLITEPYLGGGGSYHPQKEYLQLLQKFCRENDAMFILDEVQSNFGRTGSMYAFTEYGLEPDVVVLGKGLGNGVPVSAAVGRADLFDVMGYGEASDTWSANPLASAAVLATLEEFETTGVLEHARKLSATIEQGLCRLAETPIVANVRGEGVVWGVECKAAGGKSAEEVARAAVEACYFGDGQGRALHLLGPLAGKVLRVSPPIVMAIEDAAEHLDAMFQIFQSLPGKL